MTALANASMIVKIMLAFYRQDKHNASIGVERMLAWMNQK
jgi:hypothetical protein